MTIIYFIIVLGVLIFFHELGHFIAAKRSGIHVETFSLGFGPRIVGFRRGPTDYRISLLPLGGYVKMRGEDPSEENANASDSFATKTVLTRMKVIVAGSFMNLVLCLLIMPVVFMIGRNEPVFLREEPVVVGVRADSPAAKADIRRGDRISSIDGRKVKTWEGALNKLLMEQGPQFKITLVRDGASIEKVIKTETMPEMRGPYVGIEPMLFYGNEAKIASVSPEGAAAKAGISPGDKVVSFGGEAVKDWIDLSMRIGVAGAKEMPIVIDRNGEKILLKVTPEYNESFSRYVIGIMQDPKEGLPMVMRRFGFFEAISIGMKENVKLARLTFDVLERLVTFKLSYKVLGGPIIIAKVSAAAAASGLSDFLYFMAFLSMQLFVLNLLPIPVLDGGHMLYLIIEGIRRKPVSQRVRQVADQVGFVLLITLMLLVTYNDMDRVWGIGKLIKKIF